MIRNSRSPTDTKQVLDQPVLQEVLSQTPTSFNFFLLNVEFIECSRYLLFIIVNYSL